MLCPVRTTRASCHVEPVMEPRGARALHSRLFLATVTHCLGFSIMEWMDAVGLVRKLFMDGVQDGFD